MKKILLLFLSLVFLTSYGQEHYPMYSDIWSVDCNGSHMTLTKDGKGFPLMGFSIVDYIDSEKIKSYFLQSLNEFRKDYGEGPVKESEYLNKLAQNYRQGHLNTMIYLNTAYNKLRIFHLHDLICFHI